MTKFEEKIAKLQAASTVAGSIDYYIKDRTETIAYWQEQIKKYTEENGEKPDENSYYVRGATDATNEAAVWLELKTFLEQKYLK